MKAPTMEGRESAPATVPDDQAVEMAACMIRERSAEGVLVSAPEIETFLQEQLSRIDPETTGKDFSTILRRLPEHEDLRVVTGAGAEWYYSSMSMTKAYVGIVLRTLEGPVSMVAETVRENSEKYQRPVPVTLYERPPFNMEYKHVVECVTAMASLEGYDDVVMTTTSESAVYLYSTRYLETEHAEMLAEWLDVGRGENP